MLIRIGTDNDFTIPASFLDFLECFHRVRRIGSHVIYIESESNTFEDRIKLFIFQHLLD